MLSIEGVDVSKSVAKTSVRDIFSELTTYSGGLYLWARDTNTKHLSLHIASNIPEEARKQAVSRAATTVRPRAEAKETENKRKNLT